jgi:BlaI family transcriptional regulator, penicillinase repressor
MNNAKKYSPTESELEILHILWEKGVGTVRDVHEIIEQTKETGYTTTLKMMQIMTEKGLIERETATRTHVYKPVISREEIQENFLNKMLNGLFRGSAGRLVLGALDQKQLSNEEIKEIKDYLDQIEKSKP